MVYQPLLGALPEVETTAIELSYTDRSPSIQSYPILWRQGRTLLQLPAWPGEEDPQQASTEGLSLPWKELLAKAILQGTLGTDTGRNSPYLVLGGSLPQSTWGQPASARAAIDYIYAHPWIAIASPSELQPGSVLNLATWSPSPTFAKADLAREELLDALLTAPKNTTSQAAWQAYRTLFAPTFPPSTQLPWLRQEYLGEINFLLEAARWKEERRSVADCSSDIDDDGQVECILANDRTLAIFELDGGTLSHLFLACPSGDPRNAYQVIGPSSQLITGLSDPMDWNLEQHPADSPADPSVYVGALEGPAGQFQASIIPGQLDLISQDGQITKRFQLAPNGLHVEIRSQFPARLPEQMIVPILIEPGTNPHPSRLEELQSSQAQAEIAWRLDEQAQLVLHTVSEFKEISFLDSRDMLNLTENPNYAYPPGHYLPFPLVIVEIIPDGSLFLDFQIRCN